MKVLAEINYSDGGLLLPHPAHPYGTHCRRFGRRLLTHQPQGSIKKKRQRSSLLYRGLLFIQFPATPAVLYNGYIEE